MTVDQLTFDLSTLQNSIDHLLASNAEMVQAMEEGGGTSTTCTPRPSERT